jgi:hypothetical protein
MGLGVFGLTEFRESRLSSDISWRCYSQAYFEIAVIVVLVNNGAW